MRAALVLVALLAPLLAAPAAAKGEVRVTLLYDARADPPALEATLAPADAWPAPVEWPLPSGTLLRVTDEAGRPLASEVGQGGVLRVEPGEARAVRVALSVAPLVPRAPGLREGAFTAQADAYEVVPPAGSLALDRTDLPDARVVFGDPSVRPPAPPAEPGSDLVKALDVSGTRATVSLWWNASTRDLAPGDDAAPAGWRETGREDLWGALAPGVQPWRAHGRPSLLRLHYEPAPEAAALPLVGIGVRAGPAVRAFAALDPAEGAFVARPVDAGAEVRAADVALPTGAPGWTRAEGGPFVVFARDPQDAAFVARAGTWAGPVLRQVLSEAGLPARERIPVVLSPGGESGWQRWGFAQPEAFVRGLREGDRSWDEAAILVHEGFHGGQLDAAPWLDLAWWTEGSAAETDRHLPSGALCRGARTGDCFAPPTLDLARFRSERFPFGWRQPDPSLPVEETAYRYAAARHLVATYRDRAGEEAWRAVWTAIAADPRCCDHAALLGILLRAAPDLTAEDVEGARMPPEAPTPGTPGASPPAPTTQDASPPGARTPGPPLAGLLAALALVAALRRPGSRLHGPDGRSSRVGTPRRVRERR